MIDPSTLPLGSSGWLHRLVRYVACHSREVARVALAQNEMDSSRVIAGSELQMLMEIRVNRGIKLSERQEILSNLAIRVGRPEDVYLKSFLRGGLEVFVRRLRRNSKINLTI